MSLIFTNGSLNRLRFFFIYIYILLSAIRSTISSPIAHSIDLDVNVPPITDGGVCVALPSWQNPPPVPRLRASECKSAYLAYENAKLDPHMSFFKDRKFISRNNPEKITDLETQRTPQVFYGKVPETAWLSSCIMVVAMLSDFDKQQAKDNIPGYPVYEIFYAERSSWDRTALAALTWIDDCMEVDGQEPRVPKPGWKPVGKFFQEPRLKQVTVWW